MMREDVFGVPIEMPVRDAGRLLDELRAVWMIQLESLPGASSRSARARLSDGAMEAAVSDVKAMRHWFDPIASGNRLRAALDAIEPINEQIDDDVYPELFLRLAADVVILTPEGRLALWMLSTVVREQDAESRFVYVGQSMIFDSLHALHGVYRDWNRQRIESVTGLLSAETATLRPTAAGLLLVLLVNRNTSSARRLPSPEDPAASAQVTRAIAAPAMAFGRALADSERASTRGLDLYRGWAMGEIARRLGRGLHRGVDGVWIEPEYETVALQRLVESLGDRDPKTRARIPTAVDFALREYELARPVLSGLGVAHERPSNTRSIRAQLLDVAKADGVTGQ